MGLILVNRGPATELRPIKARPKASVQTGRRCERRGRSMDTTQQKLVRMANQIGRYFVAQPGGHAAADVAEHLRLYWPVSMRRKIIAYAAADGGRLDPAVREAVKALGAAPAMRSPERRCDLLERLAS